VARRQPRFLLLSLALSLALAGWSGGPRAPAPDAATELLSRLTPEQRVGQLFLVTFRGSSLPADSWILELAHAGLISGVQLSAAYGNFGRAPDGSPAVITLIGSLQAAALGEVDGATPTPAAQTVEPAGESVPRIPLLIAFRYEGDGAPWSSVAAGHPDTPSQMAIGATWDPDLARDVGMALGRNLEQLGVNLLIGPSLDILGDPRLGGPQDLGVRSFGGDPYWVGLLGESFIEGAHAGASGRLAVVVSHFPGLGASDRPAAQEIATVRRTLDQLQGFELQPFLAAASQAAGAGAGVADGMLIAHLRYQGLQGNIRDTTRPVSLDAEAFSQLMQTEPLAQWRAEGGVVMSESLGSAAMRRFIDPSGETFNAPLVARDAFLAGSDLLLLDDFRAPTDPDEASTLRATLRTFVQRYNDDPLFAQQIDEAVLRILRLKLRLYGGSLTPVAVAPTSRLPNSLLQGAELARRVARRAATLINPTLGDLRVRLGEGPRIDDRLVFFTDTRRTADCAGCLAAPAIDVAALQTAVLGLYGGGGGSAGQVRSWNLTSFATADLAAFLGDKPPDDPANPIKSAEEVRKAIESAQWLVFVVDRARPQDFGSGALKLLLGSRPELLVGKRVVVFAMDVPYDLDATDISKVDALYALYSRDPAFVDMAARLLFGELQPVGASPVSVPSIGYDLIEALSPDPLQVIELSAALETPREGTPGQQDGFRVNDAIQVKSGVILDVNGNPVPDGTPVEFILGYPGELPSIVEEPTASGVASTSVLLGRLGLLSISARSDPARSSSVVQLNVQEDMPAFVTVIAPTPVPSVTAPPAAGTTTPAASTPEAPGGGSSGSPPLGLGALLFGVSVSAALSAAGFGIGQHSGGPAAARRLALMVFVGGLLVYNYIGLRFPGAALLIGPLGVWGPGVGALLGGGLTIAAWWWQRRQARRGAGGG